MDENVDRGWAWVIAIASFSVMFTSLGVFRSTSVLYVALVEVLGITRESAAWPFSLAASLLSIVGVFVGILAEFFTIRSLVFTGTLLSAIGVALCYTATGIWMIVVYFGIIFGIGSGLAKNANVIPINQYFIRYRTMATGLSLAGSSVGSFVLPPITEYLMEEYGLKGCFLLLSAVLMQSLVAATLYRPFRRTITISAVDNKEELDIDTDEETFEKRAPTENKFVKIISMFYNLIRTPVFYVIIFTFSLNMFSFVTYQTVVVDYAADRGIPVSSGVFIVSVFSFSDLCGRLMCGWITDLGFMKRKNLVMVCCVGMASFFFCTPLFTSYVAMLIFALCLGVLTGCLVVNSYVLFTEYLGIEKLPLSLGLGNTFFGFVNFSCPLLIGYYRDVKGSYDPIFYILGALELFIGLSWVAETARKKFSVQEQCPLTDHQQK